ncbi:MAG: AAA family ATPase [Oscillospiraceae bacterium]|nr:AAA family ATPase [Oscillospiraceae bacterium]
MNIKDAKEQIKNAVQAYFTKDEYGNYCIPIQQQRPVFMMGPPGIGKTAVMEQIAAELGIGLVSYSMTHHTRQSALGLPFIEKKIYGGKEYNVSEYTMSEIIASVYDTIEKTGVKEGILFLDEINCVSETLAPSMLQFLQYKIFGRHCVPDGWLVVTAGNPPEYNNSVREFDIVTWDRLKRIDVEPDFSVWKEYAYKKGIHASILTYLDIKKDDFYKIETTVDGKSFVTARGWTDLSDMIILYEKNSIAVDEKLTAQYLQNKKIAKDFAIYYDLFNKYKSDYQVDKILDGKAPPEIKSRAENAGFDEKLSLLGLIIDAITAGCREVFREEQALTELFACLKKIKTGLSSPGSDAFSLIEKQADTLKNRIDIGKLASNISPDAEKAIHGAISMLHEISIILKSKNPEISDNTFKLIKTEFDKYTKELKKTADKVSKELSNVFAFCDEVFADGQEMLILVTELTINYYGAHFISHYGCDEYFKHNKELLFYERQKEIIKDLKLLETDLNI